MSSFESKVIAAVRGIDAFREYMKQKEAAPRKIKSCIESCKTQKQLNGCTNMVRAFEKQTGDYILARALFSNVIKRRIEIFKGL